MDYLCFLNFQIITYSFIIFLLIPRLIFFMVRENTFSDFSPFGSVKVFSILVNIVCILGKNAYSAVVL